MLQNFRTYLTVWVCVLFCVSSFSQEVKKTEDSTSVSKNLGISSEQLNILKKDSSSFKNILKKDSSLFNASFMNLKKDSSFFDKKISGLKAKTNMSGQLNWEYNYGWIPYLADSTSPSSFARAYGNVDVDLLKLPFRIQYNYSDKPFIGGLNNYFNLSFNLDEYKNRLKTDQMNQIKDQELKISDLENQRNFLLERSYYLNEIQNVNKLSALDSLYPNTDVNLNSSVPNLGDSVPGLNADSANINVPQLSAEEEAAELKKRKSAMQQELAERQKSLDQVENQLASAKNQLNKLKNAENALEETNPIKGKVLPNLQSFEMGLINPDFSPLLLYGNTMQGLNIEWEKNYHFAAAHGLSQNNLIYSLNPAENQLNNARNVLNFFDFNRMSDSQRITSMMGGFGKKEDNHFYIGATHALSRNTWESNGDLETEFVSQSEKENFVLGADLKLKFFKSHQFEAFLSKSFLSNEDVDAVSVGEGFSKVFKEKNSNAVLTRYSFKVDKIKSDFQASFRRIDPYFKNYGVGFMRSDNQRYEISSKHKLTKAVQLSLRLRREHDNILNIYPYQNELNSYGGQVRWKILRGLTAIVGYYPVYHTLTVDGQETKNKNYISNAVLTYAKAQPKANHLITVAYNNFLLVSDTTSSSYEAYNASYDLQLRKGPRINLAHNFYQLNGTDSANAGTHLSTLSLGFKLGEKTQMSAQGKRSFLEETKEESFGYGLKLNYEINKYMNIELSGEKMVFGEFYNTMNQSVNDFPYLFGVKLINKF